MIRTFAVLAALVAAVPLAAAPDARLAALQAADARLFATGWRLTTANAPFCDAATPQPGLAVLDAGAFADPAAIRRDLGLTGDLAVGAVAPGSPADAAGIAPGDTLVAIGEQPVEAAFPRGNPKWQRLIDVTATIDAQAAAGPLRLRLARADGSQREAIVTGVSACPTRFEVLDSGGKAMAEGTRVIFGRDFVGFQYPDDEFAAAVAHELAHNLLRHRRLLDDRGRSLGNQRLTEREADRLMPWLLANAGFAPDAAVRFMQRWGPRHDGGLFRNRNHEGWDERAAAIRAEVAKVENLMASTGKADWARHFERETLR